MRRIRKIILILFFIALPTAIYYLSGYIPGTLFTDKNGFLHGTGWKRFYYESGPLMLEEHYRNGMVRLSRWYRPDGSQIAETRWDHGNGVGYYLRQDGTIRTKMEYRDGFVNGPATYYREDGIIVERRVEFQDGQPIPQLPDAQIQLLANLILSKLYRDNSSWVLFEPYQDKGPNPPNLEDEIIRQLSQRYTVYSRLSDVPQNFRTMVDGEKVMEFHDGFRFRFSVQFEKGGAVRVEYEVFRALEAAHGGTERYRWNGAKWEEVGIGSQWIS
jgi:hypothetical protein